MTCRTIVAEQRSAGLPHRFHQTGIGLDLLEAFSLDPFGPWAALDGGLLQAFADNGALIDAEQVYTTVWSGRQGHMPSWDGRLSLLDRKILALYLFDLRSAQ